MSGFSVIHLKFINFFLLVKEARERRLLYESNTYGQQGQG